MRATASRAPLLLLLSFAAGCVTLDPPPVRNEVLLGLRTPEPGSSIARVRSAAFPDVHALTAAGLPPEEGAERRAVVWRTEDEWQRIRFMAARHSFDQGDPLHIFRLEFTTPPPAWTGEELPVIWLSVEESPEAGGETREFVVTGREGERHFGVFRWTRDRQGGRTGERAGRMWREGPPGSAGPWLLEIRLTPRERASP